MDNLTSQKGQRVRVSIEGRDCELLTKGFFAHCGYRIPENNYENSY